MDPKIQDILVRTNLQELVQAVPENSFDLNQPVRASESQNELEVRRSTADPLQIHFADVDMVGKIQSGYNSPGIRFGAWMFLALPMIFFAFMFLCLIWYDMGAGEIKLPSTLREACISIVGTAFSLAFGGFWPYLIWRGKQARNHAVR
jgi:hypothetical protein